jgi:hypothetical protein
MKNFIDYRLFRARMWATEGMEIPRSWADRGIFFEWSDVRCHFMPFALEVELAGPNVTDSHTQAILTVVHGVFAYGVGCLYPETENALRTA